RQAGAIDRARVEVSIVIIGDQRVVAAGRIGLDDLVEQGARVLLAQLVGDEEAADAGTVGRKRGVLDPGAVGVAEEVVPRQDALVHPAGLDPDVRARLLLRGILARAGVARRKRERR